MRVVLVVVCAACALWAMAGVDPGGLTPSVEAAPAEAPAASSDASIVGARDVDGTRADAPCADTAPKVPRARGRHQHESRPTTEEAEATTRSLSPGELGEGAHSPEFRTLAQRYTQEVRDDARASRVEAQLRASLAEAGVGRQPAVLNCRTQVCRLLFDDVDADQVQAMLHLPALHRLAGIGAETPYSLRAGQFELYFVDGAAEPTDQGAVDARVRAPTQKL